MSSFLAILSSPSGCGKTTIAKRLLARRSDLGYSVSATTRAPRRGERDGVDYHFLSRGEFQRRADRGAFLEWATYGGELYGTIEAEVDRIQQAGRTVVMDIEVQGARQVRQRRNDVVTIFILPPSAEALLERLGGRKSDHPEAVRRRVVQAVEEVTAAPEYDFIVVNDVLDEAVAGVEAILDAERQRVGRIADLATTVSTLKQGLERIAGQLPTA